MPHELELIQWIAETVAAPNALRDDTFWDASARRIYTTDMLVEGRHFDRAYFSAQDIGWKAAAVNISDIAATGGHFRALLVSLGIPAHLDMAWIQDFYRGLSAACREFGGVIAGGDTVGMPIAKTHQSDAPLVINVTAIGECLPTEHPGHRFNAKPGDYIITTGFSGLSDVGLKAFIEGQAGYPDSKKAHLRPYPRIEAGLMLASRFERYALMDSSDGLADALLKIAQASQQALIVDSSQVPLHPEVLDYASKHGVDPWSIVLYGGEDFALVATVPEWDDALSPVFQPIGRVVAVGAAPAVEKSPGAWVHHSQTQQVQTLTLDQTYQHFETTAIGSSDKKDSKKPDEALKTDRKNATATLNKTEDVRRVWAVVAAGGSGQRFSPQEDKLLADLDGKPVLQRTLEALLATQALQGIIIVAGKSQTAAYQKLVAASFPKLPIPIEWATGGATRRNSVYNGLCAIPAGVGCVVIHDAARPLIRPQTMMHAIEAVQNGHSGAIVGLPVYDTLKRTHAGKKTTNHPTENGLSIATTCSRENIWRVQTPQVFRRSCIMLAHRQVSAALTATDDAQLMEEAGFSVRMLIGQEDNIKITTRDDLYLAGIFLKHPLEKQPEN